MEWKQYYGLNVIVTYRIFPAKLGLNYKKTKAKLIDKNNPKEKPAQEKEYKKPTFFFYLHLLNIKFSSESVWRSGLKFRGWDLN